MSSLSSGSDIDEFYDAVDVTPARSLSHPADGAENSADASFDLESTSLGGDDDEEKRSSLERMRKAEENEQRRRKLEKMRSMMSDETPSPEKTDRPLPSEPPSQEQNENVPEAETPSAVTRVGSRPVVPEQLSLQEASSEDNASPEGSSPRQPPPAGSEDTAKDSELLTTPGFNIRQSASSCSSELELNLNNPANEGLNKLTGKQMPDFESLPDVPVDAMLPEVTVGDDDKPEPDIVQSAKAATLRPAKLPPPRPPPPVAPPRRKRKNRPDDVNTGSQDESGDLLSPDLKGLPMQGLPTPTSTVYSLTRDLEQSLDLQSATAGNRMVLAKKDELSAKAELTEEEEQTQALADSASAPDKGAKLTMEGIGDSANSGKVDCVSATESGNAEGQEAGNTGSDKLRVKDDELPKSEQRPRSNSGSRFLTDKEILEMVSVLNLDTGETIPLSMAEDKLPRCVNPLSLHIMRRTKEYSSDSSLHKHGSDDEQKEQERTKTISSVKPVSRKTRTKLKRFLGKTVHKIKSVADEVLHDKDGQAVSDDDDETLDGRRMIKIKASSAHKGPYDFDLLVPVQDLRGEQSGAVWTMKFSHCGRLLATGGQDNLLRIWVLKDSYAYFDDMRQKYSEAASKVSPTPSQDSLSSQSSEHSAQAEAGPDDFEDKHAPFMRRPFCIYKGHTADLLDLSWSKNYFILSSSMDKTVRLWHASRKECLCCFQHIDFVTAIAFLPRDDRYFLSGSLDGKLRLWNIPDKKVALWNEVIGQSKLITAANFCLNGRFAVVGTYDGRCVFYSTEHLKYYTQIHVRSTRGKNARGRKVTGIEPVPGEDQILVTSNDSRVRLYDLRDLTLTCKFKGCANNSSQIKASFSSNGKYIICGSEDHFVYIWRTQHEFYKYTSARRDRSDFWEGIKAHAAVVTAAIFAPQPGLIIKNQFQYEDSDDKEGPPEVRGEVIVSADFNGAIKVFINKFKPGSGM